MNRNDLIDWCDKIDFPDGFRREIFPLIDEIERNYMPEFEAIDANRCELDGYKALAEKLGKELDPVMLAACMMSGIRSRVRYDEMGISDEIYYASMRDITIWAKRCFIERGHIGVYAHDWLNNFFDPHVFRIGRLEFERKKFPEGYEYDCGDVHVRGGDGVINIHIPEDGPLRHDEVLESYKKAYKFFGLEGKYPFVTHSWLIWDKNAEILPEKSNIRDFMADYDTVYTEEGKDPCNLWRVFGRRESYDPAELPRENSLQRNFADYLAAHDGLNGVSYGIFIHDGEKIVKDKNDKKDKEIKMKTVITDGFAVNPGDLSWDWLAKYGEYTVYDKLSNEEAAEKIGDADIVFTNRVKIGEDVIAACPNLKYVSALGTGYDMIDVKKCRERGIEVCNVPGYSSASVAQLAFSLLLANAFDMEGYRNIVKDGKWTGIPGFQYQLNKFIELDGKVAGVYGCGAIGMRFAKICQSFGMKVLATRRSKTDGEIDGIEFVTPDELLARCDYISFHCPLTDETRGMVNKAFIAKMKDGAVIINTSRGAVLNEADVAEALVSGKLGGLGADVLAKEPADPENPLLSSPNTYITPHCAWTSMEARTRLMDILDKNLGSFVETGKGINRVM